MVSFPKYDFMSLCLAFYFDDLDNLVEKLCPLMKQYPRPRVYHTNRLLLHASKSLSDFFRAASLDVFLEAQGEAGFQIYFSFHNHSALPVKISSSIWNCSVPYRSDYLYHLFCNLEVECHDAEDEINCSYTSNLCGTGYLTLGGACFYFIRNAFRHKITWKEAEAECKRRGERLAILNSVDKFDGVYRLLPRPSFSSYNYFLGIKPMPLDKPSWYRTSYQWADGTTAFYIYGFSMRIKSCARKCAFWITGYIGSRAADMISAVDCRAKFNGHILCEKTFPLETSDGFISINDSGHWPGDSEYIECPLGHYVHQFQACDVLSSCWDRGQSQQCERWPSFACTKRRELVPYTLVCDHREDCIDGSDESFCSYPPCRTGQFSCSNQQCVSSAMVCDGWKDCENNDDEQCFTLQSSGTEKSVPPPALVTISDRGYLASEPLSTENKYKCPYTHFQCSAVGYCLPVILRCNGLRDCPGGEDERSCDSCPGFYRCRASLVCIHHIYLCDGHAHCLQHDDEFLCDSACPPFCVCRGFVFFCWRNFTTSDHPHIRFLDASGSSIVPAQLTDNFVLIHLALRKCGLTNLEGLSLPNLRILDVQDNLLSTISHMHLFGMPQLRELIVAGNPLALVLEGTDTYRSFDNILKIDLSRTVLPILNSTALSAFPNLQVLNLSQSSVQRIDGNGLNVVRQLQIIDLRGCPMEFIPFGLFQGLDNLEAVYAYNFKVCCPEVLPPELSVHKCFAPSDEISSCDDLMRGNEYKVCAFVFCVGSVTGNFVSFIFRSFVSKREKNLGYGVFVTHLSVSDFLMGVYLAVIVTADQVYHGTYLWNDVTWRNSLICKLAGFLSVLSSEVSALIMCLITLDRFLVLRFPFSRLRFYFRSAHVASTVVWIVGLLLALVPLLPVTSHWKFYSQTGICIPLPITRKYFAGHMYSFSIFIIFNCVIFVFICLGQLSIYLSVRVNSITVSNTTKNTKEMAIARRLIAVAMTDFLCWFPIVVLGWMVYKGVPVPGEINVAAAIFMLPLNSAVNPCLYTFNVIMQRRSRAREEKLRAFLIAQLKSRG